MLEKGPMRAIELTHVLKTLTNNIKETREIIPKVNIIKLKSNSFFLLDSIYRIPPAKLDKT